MIVPPKHYKNLSLKNIRGERWIKCAFEDTDGRQYDFSGFYMVSSMGRVKSLDRKHKIRPNCIIPVIGRICRPDNLNNSGYLRIRLTKGVISKAFLVHRLVMLCFADKIPGKNKVNHKRGFKYDNRLKMLEWTDHPENIQHAFDIGLHRGYPGEESGMATINNATAIKIFNAIGTQHEIAARFGVTRGVVCNIKTGKTWKTVTKKKYAAQRDTIYKFKT